ncbi:MAG: hypothetical protein IPK08_06540 [Bacteroidetes bacterium]|nr:hypothetical protein [Bacteroidota bacterium]MBK9045384.1 hypothetical protein [Bacteroidota bacterium]
MKLNLLVITSLALLTGFSSCMKEDVEDAPLQGSITGKVRLADEFGNILSDHEGVVLATTDDIKGNTNYAGSFLIYGLGDGVHTVAYSKGGFGTFKKFAIPVTNSVNTELTGIDTLGRLSTTAIGSLAVVANASDSTYTFNCTVSPSPDANHQRGIRLFFSRNAAVSATDYEFTPNQKWMATQAAGSISGFAASNFYNNGFSRGETIYVIAYGESWFANMYTDPETSKKVFPNVNAASPSSVVSFVLQ